MKAREAKLDRFPEGSSYQVLPVLRALSLNAPGLQPYPPAGSFGGATRVLGEIGLPIAGAALRPALYDAPPPSPSPATQRPCFASIGGGRKRNDKSSVSCTYRGKTTVSHIFSVNTLSGTLWGAAFK